MSDIGFAFTIGGRDIDPSDIKNSAEEEVINNIVESIVSQVGDLVCPEHNLGPRFVCTGDNFEELSLEVEGCCEKMVDRVKAQMATQ